MTSCSRRHSRGPSAFGTPRAASSRQFLRLGFRLEGLQHRLAVGVGDGQVLAAGWLSRQKVLRVCYGRLPAELLNDVVGSNADHLAAIPPAVRVGGIETRVVAKCILRHPFRGFKGSEFARRPSAVHLAVQDLLPFPGPREQAALESLDARWLSGRDALWQSPSPPGQPCPSRVRGPLHVPKSRDEAGLPPHWKVAVLRRCSRTG